MTDTAVFADAPQDSATFADTPADTAVFAQDTSKDTASFADDTTSNGDEAYVTGKRFVQPETLAGPDTGADTIQTLRTGLPANFIRGIAGELAEARRAVHGQDDTSSLTQALDSISTEYQQNNPNGADYFVKTAKNLSDTFAQLGKRAMTDYEVPILGGEDVVDIASKVSGSIGSTVSEGARHPGDMVGSFITGLMADPEYALIGMPEASMTGSISGRILDASLRTTGTGVAAGAMGAATSVVRQTAQTGFADPTQTTNDALQLASLGILFHGAKEVYGMGKSIKENTQQAYNVAPPESADHGPTQAEATMPSPADAVHDLTNIPDIVQAALSKMPKNPEIPLDNNTEARTLEDDRAGNTLQENELGHLGVIIPGADATMIKDGVNVPRTLKDYLTMPFEDFAKDWDGELQSLMLKHQRFVSIMSSHYTPEEAQIVERAGWLRDPSMLRPKELELYNLIDGSLKTYGALGKKLGAFNEPVEDYWMGKLKPKVDAPEDVQAAWRDNNPGKLSATSSHFFSRVIQGNPEERLAIADKLGLEPRYNNAVDSFAAYTLQVNKAFINRAAYKVLFKMPGVLSDIGATDYKLIPNHYLGKVRPYLPSEMLGLKPGKFINTNQPLYARSDIAPILDHLMDSNRISELMSGLDMANWAAKRISLFSLFHAKTLTEHQILLNGGFMDAGEILRGAHPIFQKLLYGRSGDSIEAFVKNGGTIPSPEDIGSDRFYQGVDSFKEVTDALMSKIGIPAKANPLGLSIAKYEDVSRRFDRITWQRALAGGKLLSFTNMFEQAKGKNIDRVRRGLDSRLLTDRELAEPIALTVNDIFGGQNWLRMSLDSRTEIGKRIKLLATKPASRVWAQRLIFAPDWTVSNFRAIMKGPMIGAKMVGAKVSPKNFTMNPGEAQLLKYHAYFAMRAGLVYFLAANTLNKLWAGHYIWDNKSWRTVELGDGRTMTLDKSLTEVADLMASPGKTIAGKMGILPKELIAQMGNESYMSPTASRPTRIVPKKVYDKAINFGPLPLNKAGAKDDLYRLRHLAGNYAPIAGKNLFTGDTGDMQLPTKRSIENSGAGFFGFPIYEHSNPSDQWLRGLFEASTQDPGYD